MVNHDKTYTLTGIVKSGQNKGKLTGLHTANLDTALARDLTKGLYSCQVVIDNQEYNGLLYYGYNSLSHKNCLEVHLLNFHDDLYGRQLTIVIKKYLRPAKKFTSILALKQQLKKDLQGLSTT